MTKFTVTVIDTSGIQNYVFNSNRLRENIGASHLVSEVTLDWVKETLDKEFDIPKCRQKEAIEISGLNAELVYAGGGNTLLIFKSRKIAVEFIQILSKRVLKDAPGINLVVAHADFDWDQDNNLYQVVKDLMQGEVERRKYERITSVPLLGLGVTAVCNSTQLPAVGRSDEFVNYGDEKEADSYLISRETKQKLEAVSRANRKLQDIFAEEVDENIFQFPYRTDHLGRSEGESSYAAIVHADGNRMGKRFQKYGEDAKNNRDYVNRMRKFSESVDLAGRNALKAVAKTLIKSIKEGKVIGKQGEFKLKAKYYLPFRPLVYGGDDITFICEGRLGLELAALFLNKFEEQTVADGKKITACAGICVVKTHYPFVRAYQISEELCKEAKKFVKEKKQFEPNGFSAIDWHLAASGLIGSISEIRKREYQITVDKKNWNLAMRPVRLDNNSSDWRTWEGFTQVVKEFQEGKDWKDRHNKIMALREVLRKGYIEEFLLAYKLPHLPLFPESSGQNEQLKNQGWKDGVCGYFDAIEALEFYIGLED
ncbi:Cas10/Cmr2 second palm domain-containing protein [Anabaena sp. WFMT]|uniref:Cas10/Cmr2 second palm domain-containing protein n=1 Tax=Anabaena sp. WFMT TaxID=3449730 RepID=UPI003F28C8C4